MFVAGCAIFAAAVDVALVMAAVAVVAGVLYGLHRVGRRRAARVRSWADELDADGAPASAPPFAGQPVPEDVIMRLLAAVGSRLGQGTVEPYRGCLEWRGMLEQWPFRVTAGALIPTTAAEWIPHSKPEVAFKVQNPVGHMWLRWDPSKVPEPGKPDPWRGDPPIFLGPGVILLPAVTSGNNPETIMLRRLDEWSRFPDELRAELLAVLLEHQVGDLEIEGSGLRAELRDPFGGLSHPLSRLSGLAAALGSIAGRLAALPDGFGEEPSRLAAHRATCEYCRTVFTWTRQPVCPNCGAPLKA
jgi:hypothetical protein